MIYVLFAALIMSSLGLHQHHNVREQAYALQLQNDALRQALRETQGIKKKPKAIHQVKLDGIELLDLSESQHA